MPGVVISPDNPVTNGSTVSGLGFGSIGSPIFISGGADCSNPITDSVADNVAYEGQTIAQIWNVPADVSGATQISFCAPAYLDGGGTSYALTAEGGGGGGGGDIPSSLIGGTITSFTGLLGSTYGLVLLFVSAVLVWVVLRKYLFGASRRV